MTVPQVVSTLAVSILTVIAAVIGIQIILLLKELKTSLSKFNRLLNTAEDTVNKFAQPLVGLAGVFEGVKQSTKVIETVVDFMKRYKKPTPPVDLGDDAYGTQ